MSEKIIRYDLETEIDHGIEVSNLAYATAKELGLAENLCYELAVAGMVHDIGKLRLSRYMSGEENPLVIEEIKYVRRHTQLGCEVLKK
ncbi:MAG: HDIG domain-containing protein, partial [Blautia sp.]